MTKEMQLVNSLFKGYSEGIITDQECGDMIDLVTNTFTQVIDVEPDWDNLHLFV